MLRILGLWMMVVPGILGHTHHDDPAKLRAKLAQETKPVDRGKLMVRLGRAEFEEIEKQAANNNLAEALDGLRQYQQQADSVGKALDAMGVDAEKHSGGFLQLQISVREALGRLNNILVGLTSDEQKPFLEVLQDLNSLNRHLLDELFPSQTH
jgi:hypothetical protein